MLSNITRAQMAGAWCLMVIVVGACSVIAGAAMTVGNGALLLVTCVVPPIVMLFVWRGAPPLTVAELLQSVNDASKKTRP